MRQRVRAITAGAIAAGIAACNALTGAGDLALDDRPTEPGAEASVSDGAGGGLDRGVPVDAELPPLDAPANGCVASSPNDLVGVAKVLAAGGVFELTPMTSNQAGAVVAPAMISLDAVDVAFDYSLTYAMTTPGAGLTFFAIAAPLAALTCSAGPRLCTLGASAPGFAVVLRTSKGVASDPEVPYLAIVDAQTFPAIQPQSPLLVEPKQVVTQVGQFDVGLPPAASFHRMTITSRSGKLTVALDMQPLLVDVPIPGYVPGRRYTWGVGAATGQGSTFAHRAVVQAITLTCR